MSMNPSQSDMAALQSLFGAAGQLDWSQLLGNVTLGTPAAGTPTLDAEKAGGIFGPNMGYLSGLPTTAQEGLLGYATPPNQMNLAGTSPQAMTAAPIAQFANANDVPTQYVQGFLDRFGRLPSTYSELGQFVQNPGNGQIAAAYGLATPSANGLAQTYAQRAGQPNDAFAGINYNGVAYNPGTQYHDPATLQAQQLYGNSAGGVPNPYTLQAQESSGFLGGSGLGQAGGGVATTAEQQIQNQQNQFLANLIMNASKTPADAFSYAAKLQGLNTSGTLGNLLGGNMAFAAGQPLGQLQQNPNLSNTQLATDMASGSQGGPVSSTTQNFLQRLLGVPSTGGSATNSGFQFGPGGVVGRPNPTIQGQPIMGSGLGPNQANPLLSPNSGFQTSLQAYNRLGNPTLQGLYQDLVNNTSGQTSEDFLAQLKAGAPQFQSSGAGKLSNVEGM